MSDVTTQELVKIAEELKDLGITDLDSEITSLSVTPIVNVLPHNVLLKCVRYLRDETFKCNQVNTLSRALEGYSFYSYQICLLLSSLFGPSHLEFLMEIYHNVIDKDKFLPSVKKQIAYSHMYDRLEDYVLNLQTIDSPEKPLVKREPTEISRTRDYKTFWLLGVLSGIMIGLGLGVLIFFL